MYTTRVKETHCKSCYHKIDAHSPIEGEHKPQKGDLSVCMYCGTICTFDDELNLIALTNEEKQFLQTHERKTYELLNNTAIYIQQQIIKN